MWIRVVSSSIFRLSKYFSVDESCFLEYQISVLAIGPDVSVDCVSILSLTSYYFPKCRNKLKWCIIYEQCEPWSFPYAIHSRRMPVCNWGSKFNQPKSHWLLLLILRAYKHEEGTGATEIISSPMMVGITWGRVPKAIWLAYILTAYNLDPDDAICPGNKLPSRHASILSMTVMIRTKCIPTAHSTTIDLKEYAGFCRISSNHS